MAARAVNENLDVANATHVIGGRASSVLSVPAILYSIPYSIIPLIEISSGKDLLGRLGRPERSATSSCPLSVPPNIASSSD